MNNQRILLIGGSGTLGQNFIKRYIETNQIFNMSRNENKQWELKNMFRDQNLTNFIGDIADKKRLRDVIAQSNPDIIIVASAMKHIDMCELDTYSSIQNNVVGVQNLAEILAENTYNIKHVCYISTDKACNPVSTYGLCKALSEKIIQQLAYEIKSIKFVNIRYGNVLDSSGSIIPVIRQRIQNNQDLFLTDERMTRFVMMVSESLDLIEHSIEFGKSGETIIPEMIKIRIKDLLDICCEVYNYTYKIGKMRGIEKIHEELINEPQSLFTYRVGKYYHTRPAFEEVVNQEMFTVMSNDGVLDKQQLKQFLVNDNNLI